MTEFQPLFINYVASLRSESFNITLATATKNGKPFLMLKVELNYSWNSPAKTWAHGYYDYSTQTQFPPVWTGKSSPWEHMFFAGEFNQEERQFVPLTGSPKFCANCGEKLKPGAKFCPSCGTPLSMSGESTKETNNNSPFDLSEFVVNETLSDAFSISLAETVVSLIFADYSPQDRSLLLDFLTEEFSSATTDTIVNGVKTTSKSAINLADVQKLQTAVQQGSPLTTVQAKFAELVLRKAPLSFGYWGAMKALLKFQPDKVSREAIGAGFARISEEGPIQTSWWLNREHVEDLRVLDELIDAPLAKTRYFLSRLGRRKLVQLAKENPAEYLEIATGFLIEADRSSSSIDFIYAHIIYGEKQYLAPGSRSVRRNLSSEEATPFAVDVWKGGKAELTKIWSEVYRSHEIQDFVFSLAITHNIALPPLEGPAINLALGSTKPELRAQTIDQIAQNHKSWISLSEGGWQTFLSEIDVNKLLKLTPSLTKLEYAYSLLSALNKVVGEITDIHNERLQSLSFVYFTLEPEFSFWGRSAELEGKMAAALLLSGASIEIKNFDLLNKRLGLSALISCWEIMKNQGAIDKAHQDTFIDSALGYWKELGLTERKNTIKTLSTFAPNLFIELGTTFISQTYDFELVQTFIQSLNDINDTSVSNTVAIVDLLTVIPTEDVSKTLDEVLIYQELADSISLVEVLNSSPEARLLAWSYISDPETNSLASALVTNKNLLNSTLFELSRRDISLASGPQVDVLLTFFGSSKVQPEIPGSLLAGATTNPSVELANLGHKLLKKRDILSKYWLDIAETQMPLAISFARDYLCTLNALELSSTLLLGLDSPVSAVRDMSLGLLDTLREKIDTPFIYSRLAESRDPIIRARVAEEALLSPWSDGEDLVQFDSELLVTLRRVRSARDNVMTRFDNQSTEIPLSPFVTPERISALVSLTRIGNSRDREWALSRLAQLKNAGHDIEGVSLSYVSGGSQNV